MQHKRRYLEIKPFLVFQIPGIFIGTGHAKHYRCGPGQWEKSRKRDEESQGFPAIRQGIRFEANSGVTATREKNCLNGLFNKTKTKNEDCPQQNFKKVRQCNKYKRCIKKGQKPDCIELALSSLLYDAQIAYKCD